MRKELLDALHAAKMLRKTLQWLLGVLEPPGLVRDTNKRH